MKYVQYEKGNHIAIVTMDRPEALNAINLEMSKELSQTWQDFGKDDEARVAILTGKGRAYCVGLDVKEMAEGKLYTTFLQTMKPLSFSPLSQSKPVIAAVNGIAMGAGFDFMVMDADIIVASEDSSYGMPEVCVGMASLGSPFAFANIPRWLAMEIVLTGEPFTAKRAYEIGLVNRVVPQSKLMDTALEIATKIAANSPAGVQQSRRNLLKATMANEAARIDETFAAGESHMREATDRGIKAFLEKRRENW